MAKGLTYVLRPQPQCAYFESLSLLFIMLPSATMAFFLSLKCSKHAPFPCSSFCLESILDNPRGRPSTCSRTSKGWALQKKKIFRKNLNIAKKPLWEKPEHGLPFILLFSILKMNIGLALSILSLSDFAVEVRLVLEWSVSGRLYTILELFLKCWAVTMSGP